MAQKEKRYSISDQREWNSDSTGLTKQVFNWIIVDYETILDNVEGHTGKS